MLHFNLIFLFLFCSIKPWDLILTIVLPCSYPTVTNGGWSASHPTKPSLCRNHSLSIGNWVVIYYCSICTSCFIVVAAIMAQPNQGILHQWLTEAKLKKTTIKKQKTNKKVKKKTKQPKSMTLNGLFIGSVSLENESKHLHLIIRCEIPIIHRILFH